MTPNQMKHILRTAVIAALPAALQVSCTPAPSVADNPCRGETVRTPIQDQVTTQYLPDINTSLSAGECAKLCQKLVEEQQHTRPDILGIESFTINHCYTTPNGSNGQLLDCSVNYTERAAPFTEAPGCYYPPTPRAVPGRMPAGLHIHDYETSTALGQYFAQMTAMESAAVTAFRYLVRELEAYQAPQELVEAARAAISEEINHAKLAGMLAKAHDASIPRIEVEDFQLRSLYEIALENAIEGCVNETFAAACGLWQQEHAEHETFRAVIAHVTEDECGHAALSWAIHEWAMQQLTPVEQAHIRQAQAEAVGKLAHTFLQEEHPAVRRAVGLPETADAARLFRQLFMELWEPRIQA